MPSDLPPSIQVQQTSEPHFRQPLEGEPEHLLALKVLDLHRCEFLRSYIGQVRRAIADGVPVLGYFVWSFLDNFEWEDGYTRRFGIVHVDFETQRRTPKLSAAYYSAVIRHNRVL